MSDLRGIVESLMFLMDLGNSMDGPNPSIKPCVDTGAATNVGFLSFFDALLFSHPEIVGNIYCVNKGKYKSIKMTGIVSEDTMGVKSTDLPIAVQLKNPYRNHEGRRIGITVALGISSLSISLSAMPG